MRLLILAALLLGIVTACEEREKSDTPPSFPALPDGIYQIGSPKCDTTGTSPNYLLATDGPQKAIATTFDFDNLKVNELTLQKDVETLKFADEDCELTVIRKVYANQGTTFQHTNAVQYLWKPDKCLLTKTVGDTTFKFDKSTMASVYKDSVDTSANRLVLTVERNQDEYKLSTVFYDFTIIGCDSLDSLFQVFTLQSLIEETSTTATTTK